jgi:hypothetical protein
MKADLEPTINSITKFLYEKSPTYMMILQVYFTAA